MKSFKTAVFLILGLMLHGSLEARPAHSLKISGEDSEAWLLGRFRLDTVMMSGEESNVDNGDLTDKAGFLLSSARLGFGLNLYKHYNLRLSVDLAGKKNSGSRSYSYPKLADAYVETEVLSDFMFMTLGHQRIPASLEDMVSSSSFQTISHHHTRFSLLMEANRELGLTTRIETKFKEKEETPIYTRLWFGVYNGEDIKLGRGNENDGFLIAGRGEIGLGQAPTETGVINDSSFNVNLGAFGSLQDAMSTNDKNLGADFRLSIEKIALYGVWQYQVSETKEGVDGAKPEGFPGKWERRLWSAQLSYLALFDMLEPIVRYSVVDDNVGVDNVGDQNQIYAGLNIYYEDHLSKLQFAYIRTTEKEGFERDNDQAILRFQLAF